LKVKTIKNIILLSVVTGVVFFLVYLNTLDQKIQRLFDGARWEVPSRVYARPLELYEGKSLSRSELLTELKLLNYRKVNSLNTPGEYFIDGNKVIIFSRKFDYPDGSEPQQIFQIFFEKSKITQILNRNGKNFKKLLRLEPAFIGGIYPKKLEDRVLVNINKVPSFLLETLIAVEDRKFYSHAGVSFLSIIRAAIANIKAGSRVQGGSTLTQQLVKNFFLSNEKTFMRKINEAFMAIILEIRYAKDEILEAYLNEVYLGQQGRLAIHGFGLASYFYFAKPLEELSKGEIAFMVGLVKGPSYYDPRRFPDRAKTRRNIVLSTLVEINLMSDEEAKKYQIQAIKVQSKKTSALVLYPAFIDLVKRQLKSNYPEEVLKSEGLIIYTGLDPILQKNAEKTLLKQLKHLDKNVGSIDDPLQAAIIIAENGTGEVQAIVGGRQTKSLGFNRALDARRPIGSLVKPAVYLTALSRPEEYNLVSLIDDSRFIYRPEFGDEWVPKNYDGLYHGEVPLYIALASSYNVATVRLGLNLGLENVVATLKKLDIEIDSEIYPSLLLGSIDITPLEVLKMYHIISSDGFDTPLQAIRWVTNSDGEVKNRYPVHTIQKLKPEPAYLIKQALNQVVSLGTARKLPHLLKSEVSVAGKTGTTNDLKDSWFAGFTANKTAVVWIGTDQNSTTGLTGSSGAMRVWADIMNQTTIRSIDLKPPPGIIFLPINIENGLLSKKNCSSAMIIPIYKDYSPKKEAKCFSARSKKNFSNWLNR